MNSPEIVSKPRFSPTEKDRTPADVRLDGDQGIVCKARFWIEKHNETFLSVARVTLLERIQEFGSITRAAKSMNISYRHAWKLVESINRLSREPVVRAVTGGKGGGGTTVTEYGARLMERFREFHGKFREFMVELDRVTGDFEA